MQTTRKTLCAAMALAIAVSGCAEMTPTQRGTATGAGVGAGLGAILGGVTGGGDRAAGGAILGAAAGAVAGNIWSKRMENQKREMEQATRGTGIQVSQTGDNRLKMEIPSDISFSTNRADIQPNFRPILDRFASTLNDNPAATVTIVGHTDATGSDAVNEPLSVERAARTRDYLATRGIAPSRIVVEGRGSHEPIASNNDSSGRARNRRVEIYVAEPRA
jgi:outer membrane protein OmpA-like peptidoglycan-associated protein